MAKHLWEIEKNAISRDLKGKYILIYGQPKTGKSTFGSQLPRGLFMNFENGTWRKLKKIKKTLINAKE